MNDAVGLVEALRGARNDVLARLVVLVEARNVAGVQVDLALAEHHPLGDGLAGARTFLDPHRCHRPEAPHLRSLAENRHAVGGQRQQTVDGVLLADGLVANDLGHELKRVLILQVEVGLGEGEFGGGKSGFGVRRNFVDLVQDRSVSVRADLKA